MAHQREGNYVFSAEYGFHDPKFSRPRSAYHTDYQAWQPRKYGGSYKSPYSQKALRKKKPRREEGIGYNWAVGKGYTEPYPIEGARPQNPYYATNRDRNRAAVCSGAVRTHVTRPMPRSQSAVELRQFQFASPYHPSQRPAVQFFAESR